MIFAGLVLCVLGLLDLTVIHSTCEYESVTYSIGQLIGWCAVGTGWVLFIFGLPLALS